MSRKRDDAAQDSDELIPDEWEHAPEQQDAAHAPAVLEDDHPDGLAGSDESLDDAAFTHESKDELSDELSDDLNQAAIREPYIAVEAGDEQQEQQQEPSLPFPVVAFGASAGGLQAVRQILENLPEATGMSYVLVTHLSPDQRSYLSEIMSHYTRMPVTPIEDGASPQQNHVHVLLPNQSVQLRGGVFHLEPRRTGGRVPPMPVDIFFRSLAADQRNHAIGVILSGADSDGALGLKAIKGEGGIALVQAPETAQHSSMPRSSIAADHVDLVISPAEIAVELARLSYQFARPELRSLDAGASTQTDQQSFNRVIQMVRSQTGLDLRQYKQATIRRRITRRMILLRMETLQDYVRLLQARPDEMRTLHEDVLINVTRFFRDPDFWRALSEKILPALLQGRSPDHPIRIWSAGCSSGEETYSLAMLVLEHLVANGLDTMTVQLFGTDVSDRAIEMARNAVYPESLIAELSPDRLRRFFVKVDRGFQVAKRVRDCCIFARHNLASDPPFSHIDLLSCRNVLIYFNQALQQQVISTFHYALESSGYMLLGASESLRDYHSLFNTADRKNKIYSKLGESVANGYTLQTRYSRYPSAIAELSSEVVSNTESWSELELQRAADRIVLARYAPPGLVVDDRLNVLQVRGQTAPFVELTPGAVSWSLPRVLREGVATPVQNALERSIAENIPNSVTASILHENDGEQKVQIDVLPISSTANRARYFLVLFSDGVETPRPRLYTQTALAVPLSADEKDRLVAQLRQDLSSTRFHLQSLIEERDSRNQELISANEEIQSANEELQSANEELETTKEELQSANEELQTVNDELQQRNAVLTQTGNDLNNLLTSVNMPLLMLTEDLRIRQFTPSMERLLNVRSSDIGRSIKEIRLQLSVEDIEPVLRDVLDTLGTREFEVQDREERWHLLRVRPYRTSDNKIEGLVILLVDIDQLRSSQQGLRDAHAFISTVIQSVPVPIVVLNKECVIRTANRAFVDLTELRDRELEGRSLPDLMKLLWGADGYREMLSELSTAEAGTVMETEHESKVGDKCILCIRGQAVATDGDRVLLIMIEDITLRKQAQRNVEQKQKALENEVESAERTLLQAREELRNLAKHLFTLQEDERQRVARELHDDIGQRLSVLELLCSEAASSIAVSDATESMETLRDQLHAINDDVRQLSHGLHPAILSDLGLAAALQGLVEDFRRREHMPATYAGKDVPETISEVTRTALYRIAQEALRNVSKHAGKTHVKVLLTAEGAMLTMQIRDSGIGFDQDDLSPRTGLGIISMKERARIAGGACSIQSSLGEGTTVSVELPNENNG